MMRKQVHGGGRCDQSGRLRAEGVLRVPSLHARPPHHPAQQFDQADRALRPGEADSGADACWCTTGCRWAYAYPEPDDGSRPRQRRSNKKVDVYLEFKNDKQYGLGVPLPAGRIRVSKLDAADSSLEFIGEDRIDHTPKDEQVRIKLGSAFDVVGERRQVDFAVDSKARWMEEEIEVKLRNHKDQAGECHREGEPLPLDELEDPLEDARIHEGRCAHDPFPRERGEGWRGRRALSECVTPGDPAQWLRRSRLWVWFGAGLPQVCGRRLIAGQCLYARACRLTASAVSVDFDGSGISATGPTSSPTGYDARSRSSARTTEDFRCHGCAFMCRLPTGHGVKTGSAFGNRGGMHSCRRRGVTRAKRSCAMTGFSSTK